MRPTLELRIGRGLLRAQLLRLGKTVWAGEATFANADELSDTIATLSSESPLPTSRLQARVVLEKPLVQVRRLHGIPPVKHQALRELVANQAHRFFRKNGKGLVTDARWTRRGEGAPGEVVAVAIEEPWLDAIANGASAAGLRIQGIGPAPELDGAGLELFTRSQWASRQHLERRSLRRLALIAACLCLISGMLVAGRFYRESRQIERELAALQQPAAAVIKLRREMTDALEMIETIAEAHRERSAVLQRLAAIAAALPDSAYLISLTLDRQGNGALTGAAPRATSVVAALDRGGAVVNPRLAGPAVREEVAGATRERFTVTIGPASPK